MLGSIAAVYVAGYLVRSLYLAQYGILPVEVLRPHYILTGIWFLVPLLLPPGIIAFLIAAGLLAWWQGERTRKGKRFGVVARLFDRMGCFGLLMMPLLSVVSLVLGLSAVPRELLDARPILAHPWRTVESLLGYIGVIAIAAVLLGMVLYGYYGRDLDDEAQRDLKSKSPAITIASLGMVVATGISYLAWFTFSVFPLIPQSVGGGKPVAIQLIRSPEALSSPSQVGSRLMPQCELLAEDDQTYAIRWTAEGGGVFLLDRNHYAGYQVVLRPIGASPQPDGQ